jgi:predicted nucleotidyltransferase
VEIEKVWRGATAIIFFGSRVAGLADAFSDYDVLVLLPEGLEEDERERVKKEIQATFPKIKLDLSKLRISISPTSTTGRQF